MVKKIRVEFIDSKTARAFVQRYHYSGKWVNNSQLHFGAFLGGRLHGVMQFEPSMDKRRMKGTIPGTKLNEFLELNRMAFDDVLPKNSESRCLAVALRIIKKQYTHIKWVVTFADAAQCGDGTIYRAAGFKLLSIKKNDQIWEAPTRERFSRLSLTDKTSTKSKRIARMSVTKGSHIKRDGAASMKQFKAAGFVPVEGFQIKYIYFLDRSLESLTKTLPFSEIARVKAGMYKGKRAASVEAAHLPFQAESSGAVPTAALHFNPPIKEDGEEEGQTSI